MPNNYKTEKAKDLQCYHCGESCKTEVINSDNKTFCCDGCQLVYDLLKESNLCTYYTLNSAPGISLKQSNYSGKNNYLDIPEINQKLIRFTDGNQVHIIFYVPKIHCSSCIWLLENLHKLNNAVIKSSVNFLNKEVTVIYDKENIKLSAIADLLENIGYEPLISLNDLENKIDKKSNSKEKIIKIGLAGFCFGNIMMLSFPEYFSLGNFHVQGELKMFFGYLNLILSLPVFFYAASEFFVSAWKSLRRQHLNIDAPIALAILVTFVRSVYEIVSSTGTGYMDSLCGIVFFMLIGRYFQDKTYETLSFDRDYKSYFPIAVTRKNENGETSIPVSQLKTGDHIIVRNNELIPVDAKLLSDYTHIDYSFVTGEAAPVKKILGELIYAGGRQLDGAVELEATKEVSQSYLTKLWNDDAFTNKQKEHSKSFINKINLYFTVSVLVIAAVSFSYWFMLSDFNRAMNALTAILIVACPCALLLSATFTNGNMLRIFGRNKFYIKNSSVIERLAKIDTIVFDKTGTITLGSSAKFIGQKLNDYEFQLAASLSSQSSHPLSRKIGEQFLKNAPLKMLDFEEVKGYGIKGNVDGKYVIMGSEYFVTGFTRLVNHSSSKVFLSIDGIFLGYFSVENAYRSEFNLVANELDEQYNLKILSGDNDAEKDKLKLIFKDESNLRFNQKPNDKLEYIEFLQNDKQKVMMVGDGLNDAGALMQSDVGIAVSDNTNNFSPACDAILDGSSFGKLKAFLDFAKSGKKIIWASFVVSVVYNIVSLSYAVQGILSPVIAAIIMPISSISIVVLTTLASSLVAKRIKL